MFQTYFTHPLLCCLKERAQTFQISFQGIVNYNSLFIEYVVWALSFDQLKGGCVSRTPLSCRKSSLWEIIESPWQERIARLEVNKTFFYRWWFASTGLSDLFGTIYWNKISLDHRTSRICTSEVSNFKITQPRIICRVWVWSLQGIQSKLFTSSFVSYNFVICLCIKQISVYL